LNAKELADLLGEHPENVRRKIRQNKIKADKVGKGYSIPDSEVERLLYIKRFEDGEVQDFKDSVVQYEQNVVQMMNYYDMAIERHLKKIVTEMEFTSKELERWDIDPKTDPNRLKELLYIHSDNSAYRIYKYMAEIRKLEEMKENIKLVGRGDLNI